MAINIELLFESSTLNRWLSEGKFSRYMDSNWDPSYESEESHQRGRDRQAKNIRKTKSHQQKMRRMFPDEAGYSIPSRSGHNNQYLKYGSTIGSKLNDETMARVKNMEQRRRERVKSTGGR